MEQLVDFQGNNKSCMDYCLQCSDYIEWWVAVMSKVCLAGGIYMVLLNTNKTKSHCWLGSGQELGASEHIGRN